MKIDATFLRSKVARRIFMLFICCALLPIAALAIISFSHVTTQLNEQSQRRLHQASKAAALAMYERLLFLEAEMKMRAANLATAPGAPIPPPAEELGEGLKQRFKALAVVTDAGRTVSLFGRLQAPPEPTPAEKQHIISGKTLVSSQHRPDLPPGIFLSRAVDPPHLKRGILLGEVDTTHLWGIGSENTLPTTAELCVLDQSNRVLFCSLQVPASFPRQVARTLSSAAPSQFAWRHEGQEYLASAWPVFLQFAFFVPKWTVVLSESTADVLAPMANFKKSFPLVILMSLWVVLLLSIIQIRRSLVPLEKLQEGTRRIAMRDFKSRVTVTSGDEFEELAASFNTMASRLGRQFNALTTMSEIDRAILSALDTEKIVDTVLTHMRDVCPCDGVSVTLLDFNATDTARTYVRDGKPGSETVTEAIGLTPEEVQTLLDNPESVLLDVDEEFPRYVAPLVRRGMPSVLVLPMFLQHRVSGMITLGHVTPPGLSQEDLVQARQVADQVAVALSNARLIEELDQLNWGTLTALARAIDAKSPWTAGHSERVTKLALKIGRVLGLPQKELDVLHRGGLLHDIGKLGTPAPILDKPGKLTDEEVRLMREHVRMGARILEPIAAYAEVLPIVLQHHEAYDGTGYPDGLAGETISLGGRIFAVADFFDALISDRPYRAGLDRERVIEFIKQGAGQRFDPKVVQAFLEVMAQEEGESQGQAAPARPSDRSTA
jgi:putative nucleotidyltransferase with HDIG domain